MERETDECLICIYRFVGKGFIRVHLDRLARFDGYYQ